MTPEVISLSAGARTMRAMRIERDRVVGLEYKLEDDDGKVIDTNQGGEPLYYLHGHGNIVPGLERALEGKEVGASLDVVVEPADGYGEPDPELVFEIPRSELPEGLNPQRDMKIQIPTPGGRTTRATITKVKLRTVVVDANHELAGQRLHFSVRALSVRKAKPDEIAHGHAHAPGHHHH